MGLLRQRTAEVLLGEVSGPISSSSSTTLGLGTRLRGGVGCHVLIAEIADTCWLFDAKLRERYSLCGALCAHTLATVTTVMLGVGRERDRDEYCPSDYPSPSTLHPEC